MKLVKRPKPLFKGERVVAVDPPFATHVSERWNRRINYYTGRTLTHTALNVEQHNHSSHLTLYGGQLSTGVVQGLEFTLENNDSGIAIDEQRYLIQPGSGLSSKGEDIVLSQPLLINVDKLPVIGQLPTDTSPPRGVGIVILQPIVADSAGDFDDTDPCEIDPANDAFEDWQVVDGLRAAWYPWPSHWPLPLPPYLNRLRNRLAYIIYEQERKAGGVPLPWDKVGVPLALVHVLADGRVDFIDRHAVVRQGGIPNPRQALLATYGSRLSGSPFLWQARILGLAAHMQELRDQGLGLKEALTHFQYLPPVGVLPPDIVDFNSHQSDLLPSQYEIEAAPIPLQQFEVAIEAAASAEAFDLFVPDRIKVLVPVPQQFYEPRLLKRETVDPIFEQTINELLYELGGELGRREELRSMNTRVLGAMDKDLITVFAPADPDAVPGEVSNDVYVIKTPHDENAQAEVEALYDWLKENSPLSELERDQINPKNLGSLSFLGVQHLIDDLQNKIDVSNHKIDFGFLRVQTDIYRFRQMMLGNVEATRLATSPILANIAQGMSSHATQQNLKTYFDSIAPQYRTVTAAGGAASGGDIVDGISVMSHGPLGAASSDAAAGGGSSGSTPVYFVKRADTSDMRYTAARSTSTLAADTGASVEYVSAPSVVSYQAYAEAYQPSAEDVESKSPIVGEALEFRSTSVAERISDPPAPEARSYAVASKAAVYSDLTQLPINIDGIEIPLSGSESAVLTNDEYKSWLEELKPSHGESAVLLNRAKVAGEDAVIYLGPFTESERKLLGADESHLRMYLNRLVGSNKRALKTPGLAGLILSGFYDPHPNDGDEGAFLSVGVSALESTVGTLRRIERRIIGYKQAVVQCKKALTALQKIAALWQQDLDDSQDKLREHRHDVTVARALLQEEQTRVATINARRQEILQNHVSFIGYMRPRTISIRKDMPAIQVHGEFIDPVPACLKQDIPGPDELQDMVNLFRDIPIKWLPYSKNFLLTLDSYHVIKSVFTTAKQKAVYQLQINQSASIPVTKQMKVASSKYGIAVNSLVTSHRDSQLGFVQNKAALNLQVLDQMSWKEVSIKAQDELSLQDLIESGRGKSGLAQNAARELENIQDVAVCLYSRLGDTSPTQRLLWADQLSEFDEPVSLKNLEVLPQWNLVEFDLRRDLQRLCQWLFSRIDNTIPGAVTLMNDLVRVCILLASHAPVSSIINGHLPEPATGKVGDIVRLAIDKGLVRLGMQVGIFNGVTMTVQGIVEDMNADEASIKITRSKEQTYHLDRGAKAQFYSPNTVLSLLS